MLQHSLFFIYSFVNIFAQEMKNEKKIFITTRGEAYRKNQNRQPFQ